MSHSVPSESSAAESLFVVGADLVTFDRHELPIYAMPQSLWADAGNEAPLHGASVDRLFGELGETFMASVPLSESPHEVTAMVHDPLVALSSLNDGLVLPGYEHPAGLDLHSPAMHTPDVVTVYDFSGDSHFLLPVHDGSNWDLARPEWFYDHHV